MWGILILGFISILIIFSICLWLEQDPDWDEDVDL